MDHPEEREFPTPDELLRFVGDRAMKLLDVVALINDAPEKALQRGQVGTIVEVLAPGVFEVEFSDLEGLTYASVALPESRLMVLRHEPVSAAA
jgi:hypothetical protein